MVRDSIKQVLRPFIPKAVLAARRRIRARLASHWQSPAEMFGRIYRDRLWGRNGLDFFSGLGSHDPAVVEPYVAAVRSLLSGIRPPPVVVDIGCGDFAVGSRLTDLARLTVACDVVPQLIVRNRVFFGAANVTFLLMDAAADPLPPGDIVIVKQVLQHLRNDQIDRIVRKLAPYRTWIISEHVPLGAFVANVDMLSGGGHRLPLGSGVVLTERPFAIRPQQARTLCETAHEGGIVRTIAYMF